MLKTLALAAVLASALSSGAVAAMLPAPVDSANPAIAKVAGLCGIGWYRAGNGHCYPKYYHPYHHYHHYHCWWHAGVKHCHYH